MLRAAAGPHEARLHAGRRLAGAAAGAADALMQRRALRQLRRTFGLTWRRRELRAKLTAPALTCSRERIACGGGRSSGRKRAPVHPARRRACTRRGLNKREAPPSVRLAAGGRLATCGGDSGEAKPWLSS